MDKPREEIRITNANVIDIRNGNIMTAMDILIADGKILALEKSPKIYSDNVELIDGSRKYVIPGLWDLHIHLRGGDSLISANRSLLPLYLAHGVTTVRDAGGDLTPSIMKWREAVRSGEIAGPYIFTSGPKLDGPDPTWEGSIEINSPEEVAAAVDSLESIGVDYVKTYDSRMSGDVYLSIIQETQKRGLKVTGHMPMTVSIDEAIDAGLDGIDHLYYVLKGTSSREEEINQAVISGEMGFWGAVRELLDSYEEEIATEFYKKLAENNVAVVPTLHIDDVLSYLHEEDHSGDEFLKYIPDELEATYQRRLRSALRRNEASIEFEEQMNLFFKDMVNDMYEAGVLLLAGSDAGAYNSFVYPGLSLHKELEAFQTSGLTPLQALQTSSLNGATFLEENAVFWRASSEADLILLNENPLDDVANTTSIFGVMQDGKYYSREDLDAILEAAITD
ncbi:amidohydrolase family protein [Balneola sp. MJW-20]|uniref:amidohydrolase family protein n=1 Tax=Gracilimonas aurantiaca TaxID=3234185 RepID=UPI003465FFA8